MRVHAADPHAARVQAAMAAQDWELLVRHCKQALRKERRHLLAHRHLGFALHKQRKSDEALQAYKQAAALWPEDAELLLNYANVLFELRRNREALPFFEKVCRLRPDRAICWVKLAQNCYEINLHEQGFEAAGKAMALAETVEDKVSALIQLAIHRRELGQIREAIADCESAIRLIPGEPVSHTNRLLFMLADPDAKPVDILKAGRDFSSAFEQPIKPHWPTFSDQRHGPWRRLKIGFLSPDFRMHAVMYSIEGLLAQLDRRQFEIYAFYLYPREDSVTERVKYHADHFYSLAGLSTSEQVESLRKHQIDILVDLAGHTGHNALLALAHKVAPLQISWLGYPATTGLDAIDYKFTDEVTDPPGADTEYSERLYRLPTLYCCYRPMSRNPLWRYQPSYQVRSTPALENGFVTFGSCNNLGKLTDEVLTLWGQVLKSCPNARLLIEGKSLEKPDFRSQYQDRCARLGIDINRLDLVPLDPKNQYLTYHRIDIALDPFPLTGGTTTFDVLWMGVPLVSMYGSSFKSRMGTGILTYLGRTEWLAHDKDEYLRIARALASDIASLNALRLNLRQEVEQSPLMREDLFCHYFGEGLRAMWLQWLAQGQHPGDTEAQSHLIESWLPDLPAEWSAPAVPGVGVAPGKRITLPQAHARLETLLEQARQKMPAPDTSSGQIEHRAWQEVTDFAEHVLCAVPHDPVALTCLAEVEHAHGHTDFAVTYLRYAQEAMAVGE